MISEKYVKGIPGFHQFPSNQPNHRMNICALLHHQHEYVLLNYAGK